MFSDKQFFQECPGVPFSYFLNNVKDPAQTICKYLLLTFEYLSYKITNEGLYADWVPQLLELPTLKYNF